MSQRELHGRKLFGYSIGFTGILLADIFRGSFVFQYYVYTINLNALLVTIGLAIRLIVAALSSIIFGVLADNKKPGRFGKRRPFLFYLLPVWFISSILVWFPPWYCPKNNSMHFPTAIYLWVILAINAVSGMSILSAHASMLPEQSQTHSNREKVASIGVVMAILASVIALFLPLFVQSLLENPENVKWWEPSGKIILFYIPIFGIITASFAVLAIISTFFSVDESFHKINPDLERKKTTIKKTFQQMIVPARDKKFRKLMLVGFFTSIAGMIMGILIFPMLTYVVKFRGNDFFIYIIVSLSCKFAWFAVWKLILKKHALVKSYIICIAFAALASFLELFFLIEFLSFELRVVLFVITMGTLLGAIYGFGLFASPLAGAIIYEAAGNNTEEKDINEAISEISGAYFGLQSFLWSVAGAIGSLIIGLILMGPNEENPVVISITFASISIFYLISLLILRGIEINEDLLDSFEINPEEVPIESLK
ncbi:MAG: MFS transporter [Promethearchaeota archaeon]